MRLIGIKLGVNEMLIIILVCRTEAGNGAGVFAIARADVTRARESAVIASAFPKAVEPFGTVGLGAGPFADDGPFVCSGKLRGETAGGRDMVRGAQGDLAWREDLILMSIEDHILVAGRSWGHEPVPVRIDVLKRVMNAGCVVATGSCDRLVAVLIEGLELIKVEGATKGLVEELDGRDDVSVASVALSEVLKRGQCLANRITLLPINRPIAPAVVEAILRARCSMKIEYYMKSGIPSPLNSLIQDWQLSLDVWVTIQGSNGPISNGNADMVEAVTGDF